MADAPRIYVDAAPFIDLVKVRVGVGIPDGQQKDAWVLDRVLQAARDGVLDVFTSTLSIAECTHVSDPGKFEEAKPFFLGLLASGKSGVRLVQTTLSVG
jgi:hypothetical protein